MIDNWLDYELLDWGDGRKFERFGQRKLIRPCPAAEKTKSRLNQWVADAEFVLRGDASASRRGVWRSRQSDLEPWTVKSDALTLTLKLTPFGHVGVFPEHVDHWRWALGSRGDLHGQRILHLFAYTGTFSLLLASRGATVTHVDASASAVRWARQNAKQSGAEQLPIRWIVEDAMRFVRRECNRGANYDGFVLDPPTFGRGPRNEMWRIDRDLEPLLDGLKTISSPTVQTIVLSSHTPETTSGELASHLSRRWTDLDLEHLEAANLYQFDSFDRRLSAGTFARWKSPVDEGSL
jgi:23S rRNA (cytosine1962-C5)-methyltransferase